MKKYILILVTVLLTLLVFTACSDSSEPGSSAVSSESPVSSSIEDDAVQLIRSMMQLDYGSMTVEDFNRTIQQLCTDADTNVFNAISHAYDYYAVYDDMGEFTDTMIHDRDLELFLQTTLSYSAQEIFGEPVHMGTVMYYTMPGMTALQLNQKIEGMSQEEWNRYFDENIADINVYPVLSYEIEADIRDTLTVSERDDRINNLHKAVREYFLGLNSEAAESETLENDITKKLQEFSSSYSDDKIAVECRLQALERGIENE